MVGTMASFTSSTIVNVAIPELSRHFELGHERVQWISAGFMVAMIPALSVTPWLLQRFGLRRTYAGATLLLMLGGLAGGLSGNFYLLVAMRAAEGIASGILQPIPSIVILRAFPMNEQGRAMGIYGLGVVLAPAAGPSFGGVLIEHFGWRSIFFVAIPFGLLALALGRRYLPLAPSLGQQRKPLDWKGLALIAAGTVCLLNGLAGLHRALDAGPWILLALGLAGLGWFVACERRTSEPLVQMRLFAHRPVLFGSLVSFICGVGIFGSTYLLPVFLQLALAYSPSQAGLTLFPAGLALGLAMPLGGRMADALPARPLVVAGVLLLALSLGLVGAVTPQTSYGMIIALIVLGRIGLAILFPALSLGSARGLDSSDLAQAMSINSFTRQLGGAIGISALGILLEWRLAAHQAGGGVADTSGVLAAFSECFFCLAAVSAVAAVAAAFMTTKQA
jgi:EmrB/QacA subfamily drug resistance transporter